MPSLKLLKIFSSTRKVKKTEELNFDWMKDFPVDLKNPSWLPNRVYAAHLSALVYDYPLFKKKLTDIGYTDHVYIDIQNTQLAIAVHKESNHAVIVFEGTKEKEDWRNNVKFSRVFKVIKHQAVGWHRGFDDAGAVVDDVLNVEIDVLKSQGLSIYTIGHSLGSALSLRAAILNFNKIDGVYRIAPPRFGNAECARLVSELPFYVVSVGSFFDSVTWIPFWPLYRHEKGLILLDVSRKKVVEVIGLRESWCIIIRWSYIFYYGASIAGLFFLNMWWNLPTWTKNIRRLWRDHAAAEHYATQMLLVLESRRRDISYAALDPTREKEI